jgi:anti-anti-sigma factor
MTHPVLSVSTGPDSSAGPAETLTVAARRAPPAAVVLTVRGSVDLATSALLAACLIQQLRDSHRNVVVDLTRVTFFGAAGLTVLVTAREAAAAAGVRLSLVARTRVVLLPITITGLDREFDIRPDLAGALRGAHE